MPRSSRLTHSIRWRFTLAVSAVAFGALGIAFVIIYRDTGSRLRTQIEHDLRADVAQLTQSLRLVGGGSRLRVMTSAEQYVQSQPFRSISTVLLVLAPGATPVSNYPELLAQPRAENGESTADQARENALTQRLRSPRPGLSTEQIPDVGAVRLLERRITIGGLPLVIGAAEPLTSVARAQHSVVHSFVVAGILIVIAVLLGSYLVGTRLTAPLRRMAQIATEVDGGDLTPRMQAGRRDEIGILATSFNHMLERLDEAFTGQREYIADASHELRTPLTVVQGQLEVLANRPDPDRAEIRRVERLVLAEIGRMRRIVDDLLMLARAEQPDFLQLEAVDLRGFIEQLLDDATLVADRRFELGDIPRGRLEADPDRLAQAIRNLIGNAIEHTAAGGLVRIEGALGPRGTVRIAVIDDGPGIPPDQLERIFQRFHRIGGARPVASGGAGLGLAIVRAIAEAHGGHASAAPASGGGARLELELPGFAPAPAGDRHLV